MNTFPILIIIGRPASGKSEIIDFLQCLDDEERQRRFHIANMDILDDFPLLWDWFDEDDLLSHKLGAPRLHTDEDGYFKYPYLWHLLIERLSLDYHKRLRDQPDYHNRYTTIIEFARGIEHGGYTMAFEHLSKTILNRASVIYVNVSYEESLRKNRRRFNPERPDSILEHALPDKKLERLYKEDDWETFSAPNEQFLTLRSQQAPYAIFENSDDVTTGNPDHLSDRLESTLKRLWILHQSSFQP